MIRPAVIAKDGRESGYNRISGSNRPPFRLANQTMAQSTNYPPYKLPNTVPIKGPANMYPTAGGVEVARRRGEDDGGHGRDDDEPADARRELQRREDDVREPPAVDGVAKVLQRGSSVVVRS